MKMIHLLRSKVAVLVVFLLGAAAFLLFHSSHYFKTPLRDQRPDISVRNVQENLLFEAFVAEESPRDDVPDMVFMRKFGRLSHLPQNETEINAMTRKELLYIYHSYLDNTDFLCHRKLRMGLIGDGGWEVCDDYAYRPIKPCIVYSFGINNDFSFDDDISKLYDCDVYAFDPSMAVKSHDRSHRVHFYQIGLSGPDRLLADPKAVQWELMTYREIQSLLQHQNKTIDVLKIDIEFAEWQALPHILSTGVLGAVRQLLIEFHTERGDGAEKYQERLKMLAGIESQGFRRFHTHMNPWGYKVSNEFPDTRSTAYEVYFVNTKLARPRDPLTTPHPLP